MTSSSFIASIHRLNMIFTGQTFASFEFLKHALQGKRKQRCMGVFSTTSQTCNATNLRGFINERPRQGTTISGGWGQMLHASFVYSTSNGIFRYVYHTRPSQSPHAGRCSRTAHALVSVLAVGSRCRGSQPTAFIHKMLVLASMATADYSLVLSLGKVW